MKSRNRLHKLLWLVIADVVNGVRYPMHAAIRNAGSGEISPCAYDSGQTPCRLARPKDRQALSAMGTQCEARRQTPDRPTSRE